MIFVKPEGQNLQSRIVKIKAGKPIAIGTKRKNSIFIQTVRAYVLCSPGSRKISREVSNSLQLTRM